MMNVLGRSLEILAGATVKQAKDYVSNINDLVNDANEIKGTITGGVKTVNDKIREMRARNGSLIKTGLNWFYQRNTEFSQYDLGDDMNDEFDPGFKDEGGEEGEESSPQVIDAKSMKNIARGQVAAMYQIGGKQVEAGLANTAEIVTTFNNRSCEIISSINNLNKSLLGISDRLNKIAAVIAEPENEKEKGSSKNGILRNGRVTLSSFFNSSVDAIKDNPYLGMAKMLFSFGQMGAGPEDFAQMLLSSLVFDKVKIGGKSINKWGEGFNKALGNWTSDIFSHILESDIFKKYIGDFTKRRPEDYKDYYEESDYNREKAVFDGMTRKSIVDVIPNYLREITQSLTGLRYEVDSKGNLTTKKIDMYIETNKRYAGQNLISSDTRDAIKEKIKDTALGTQIDGMVLKELEKLISFGYTWVMYSHGEAVFSIDKAEQYKPEVINIVRQEWTRRRGNAGSNIDIATIDTAIDLILSEVFIDSGGSKVRSGDFVASLQKNLDEMHNKNIELGRGRFGNQAHVHTLSSLEQAFDAYNNPNDVLNQLDTSRLSEVQKSMILGALSESAKSIRDSDRTLLRSIRDAGKIRGELGERTDSGTGEKRKETYEEAFERIIHSLGSSYTGMLEEQFEDMVKRHLRSNDEDGSTVTRSHLEEGTSIGSLVTNIWKKLNEGVIKVTLVQPEATGSGDYPPMNMSRRGCGPTALADLFNRKNGLDPESLAERMYGSGAYDPNAGTSVDGYIKTADKLGMKLHPGKVTQGSVGSAKTLLGSGYGFGTHQGNLHFMNILGSDGSSVYTSNPMYGGIHKYPSSLIAGNSVLGLYGSGDEKPLDENYGLDDYVDEKMSALSEWLLNPENKNVLARIAKEGGFNEEDFKEYAELIKRGGITRFMGIKLPALATRAKRTFSESGEKTGNFIKQEVDDIKSDITGAIKSRSDERHKRRELIKEGKEYSSRVKGQLETSNDISPTDREYANEALQMMQAALADGDGKSDLSGIIKVVNKIENKDLKQDLNMNISRLIRNSSDRVQKPAKSKLGKILLWGLGLAKKFLSPILTSVKTALMTVGSFIKKNGAKVLKFMARPYVKGAAWIASGVKDIFQGVFGGNVEKIDKNGEKTTVKEKGVVGKFGDMFKELGKFIFDDPFFKEIKNTFKSFIDAGGVLVKIIKTSISFPAKLAKGIASVAFDAVMKAYVAIDDKLKSIGSWIGEKWDKFMESSEKAYARREEIRVNLEEGAAALGEVVREKFGNVRDIVKRKASDIKSTVKQKTFETVSRAGTKIAEKHEQRKTDREKSRQMEKQIKRMNMTDEEREKFDEKEARRAEREQKREDKKQAKADKKREKEEARVEKRRKKEEEREKRLREGNLNLLDKFRETISKVSNEFKKVFTALKNDLTKTFKGIGSSLGNLAKKLPGFLLRTPLKLGSIAVRGSKHAATGLLGGIGSSIFAGREFVKGFTDKVFKKKEEQPQTMADKSSKEISDAVSGKKPSILSRILDAILGKRKDDEEKKNGEGDKKGGTEKGGSETTGSTKKGGLFSRIGGLFGGNKGDIEKRTGDDSKYTKEGTNAGSEDKGSVKDTTKAPTKKSDAETNDGIGGSFINSRAKKNRDTVEKQAGASISSGKSSKFAASAGAIGGALGSIGKILGGMFKVTFGILKIFTSAIAQLSSVKIIMSSITRMVKSIVRPLGKTISTLWKALKPVLTVTKDCLKLLVEQIGGVVEVLVGVMKPIMQSIADLLPALVEIISKVIVPIVQWIAEKVLAVVTPIITKYIAPGIKFLCGLVEHIFADLKVKWLQLKQWVADIIRTIALITRNDEQLTFANNMDEQAGKSLLDAWSDLKTANRTLREARSEWGKGPEEEKPHVEYEDADVSDRFRKNDSGGSVMDGNLSGSVYGPTNNETTTNNTNIDNSTGDTNVTNEYGSGDTNIYNTYGAGNRSQSSYGSFLNMKDHGCGPVALADRYSRVTGNGITPVALAKSMSASGDYNSNRGTTVGSFVSMGRSMGMNMSVGGVNNRALRQASPTNPITVIGSGGAFGTHQGNNHYMNVVGSDNSGHAYVSNPMRGGVSKVSISDVTSHSIAGLYGSGDEVDVTKSASDMTYDEWAANYKRDSETDDAARDRYNKLVAAENGTAVAQPESSDTTTSKSADGMLSADDIKSNDPSTLSATYGFSDTVTDLMDQLKTLAENFFGIFTGNYSLDAKMKKNEDKAESKNVRSQLTEENLEQVSSLALEKWKLENPQLSTETEPQYLKRYTETIKQKYELEVANQLLADQIKKEGTSIDSVKAAIDEEAGYRKEFSDGVQNAFDNGGTLFDQFKALNENIQALGSAIASSAAYGGSSSGYDKEDLIKSTAMVYDAYINSNPSGTYSNGLYGSSVTLRNGVTRRIRPDCSGMVSAGIQEMGFKLKGAGESGLRSWDFAGANENTLILDPTTGEPSSDWIVLPFSSSELQRGDITAGYWGSHGHVSLPIEGLQDSWPKGLDGGGTENIRESAKAAKAYLDGNSVIPWRTAMGPKWCEGGGAQKIWRYIGKPMSGMANQGRINMTDWMNKYNWFESRKNDPRWENYHAQAVSAGVTPAQEAYIAGVGIIEDGAKKLLCDANGNPEKSLTHITHDCNGQAAFGISNWIPKNPQGNEDYTYGSTVGEQIRKGFVPTYFGSNPSSSRGRTIASNISGYSDALKQVIGYAPKLGAGQLWGEYLNEDLLEGTGHGIGTAVVPGEWNQPKGHAKYIGSAAGYYNWLFDRGYITLANVDGEKKLIDSESNKRLIQGSTGTAAGDNEKQKAQDKMIRDADGVPYKYIVKSNGSGEYYYAQNQSKEFLFDAWKIRGKNPNAISAFEKAHTDEIMGENGKDGESFYAYNFTTTPASLKAKQILQEKYDKRKENSSTGGKSQMSDAITSHLDQSTNSDWLLYGLTGKGDSPSEMYVPPINDSTMSDYFKGTMFEANPQTTNNYYISRDEGDAVRDHLTDLLNRTFEVRSESIESILTEMLNEMKKEKGSTQTAPKKPTQQSLFDNDRIPHQIERLMIGKA